jgi:RNA polymerase sigma factor (sigma-70 family)
MKATHGGTLMNKEAVEALCRKDSHAIRDMLRNYEADWLIVDDLEQDVLVRALESEYDNKSKPLTWIVAIARNVGRQHVRSGMRDKRHNEVLESGLSGIVDDVGNSVEYYDRTDLSRFTEESTGNLDPVLDIEAEDAWNEALSRLPPRTADCLRLRREGYSNPDIAAHLHVSLSVVENHISSGRNYLASCYENSEFTATNKAYERVEEREADSILDWAVRATRLPRRASMDDVVITQLKRFRLADKAIALRQRRMRCVTQ